LLSFVLIWCALGLYSFDLWRSSARTGRRRPERPQAPAPERG
jgi:hypothetical protein